MIPTPEEAIVRLLWALGLGAIVGFEREFTQKSAGLRTHILVCMGSAVFTLISVSDWIQRPFIPDATELPPGVVVSLTQDPGRIMAQIVTGIGFIGGGALLHYGNNVRGVTTAASLWIMASVGMLAGLGQTLLAFVAAALSFLVLFTLGKLERILFRKHIKPYEHLTLTLLLEPGTEEATKAWIEKKFKLKQALVLATQQSTHQGSGLVHMAYMVNIRGSKQDWKAFRKKLDKQEGVVSTGLKLNTNLPAPTSFVE